MRLPSPRFLIGLVLVLVASVGVALLLTRQGDPPVVSIKCIGGSEKSELMEDPDVRRILHDRYQLAVTFEPAGSYEQVQLSTEDLNARGADCLWPASASAQSVFEANHPPKSFPAYRAETVLHSPEVLYAGTAGTAALINSKLVEDRDGRLFLTDLRRFLLDYVLKRQTWESIGTAGLRGPITMASTDAAKSNSGFTLAQLQLNVIATNDVYSAPSAEQAKAALPTIRALYDAQGLQARSSDFGFNQWLLQGGELHAPLYAGYENQIVQYLLKPGANKQALRDNVRVLYPDPTIYNDHPILALKEPAHRFIDAMKDHEIQTLAWQRFGFRSGTEVGINDVSTFPDVRLAQQMRTTQPPSADVTLLLLRCMADATKCS